MFYLAHLLIVTTYVACPVVSTVLAVRARRRDRRSMPLRRVARAVLAGVAIGVLVPVAYAYAAKAEPRPSQVAVTAYLATSFILLLGILDRGLWRVTQAVFRLGTGGPTGRAFGLRVSGALLLRAVVVGGLGIPYVLAVTLTYHPKAGPTTNPGRLYGWAYEPVTFPATDGTRIAGWWIPAGNGPATQTLVLCPGATGGPAAVLPLIAGRRDEPGLRADYNVLTFDFRGQGDSAGQLTSFGDLERRDVLGAVRWLAQTHPDAAHRIVGLGFSTGAAALLAAAADDHSEWGQRIDAVAVYAPYDRLTRVVASAVGPYAPPPLVWLIRHVGLPLAGLQVGADLTAFAPADAAAQLWPRPVLVVHGMDDEVIPFAQGQAVYDAAAEPKQSLFIGQCGHADSLRSTAALHAVKQYFSVAKSVI